MKQRTIKKSFTISGKGLHTGNDCKITLIPARNDYGIVFVPENGTIIPLSLKNTYGTFLSTVIGTFPDSIGTIEHIMSALYGLSIDNIKIEVSGGEIPILDGSAKIFTDIINTIGFQEQGYQADVFKKNSSYTYTNNDSYISYVPNNKFIIDCTIDFNNIIGKQNKIIEINYSNYIKNISFARTFCDKKSIEQLKSRNLIKGGSLDNAIVFDDHKILNKHGLRRHDEFVTHKILDFIGDISIIGKRTTGYYKIYKPGHTINNEFIKNMIL